MHTTWQRFNSNVGRRWWWHLSINRASPEHPATAWLTGWLSTGLDSLGACEASLHSAPPRWRWWCCCCCCQWWWWAQFSFSSDCFSHAPRLPSNPHIRNPSLVPTFAPTTCRFARLVRSYVRSLSIDANLSLLCKRCREDVHANWDWDWNWELCERSVWRRRSWRRSRRGIGVSSSKKLGRLDACSESFRGPGYKYKWSFVCFLFVCVGLSFVLEDIYIHTLIYMVHTHGCNPLFALIFPSVQVQLGRRKLELKIFNTRHTVIFHFLQSSSGLIILLLPSNLCLQWPRMTLKFSDLELKDRRRDRWVWVERGHHHVA